MHSEIVVTGLCSILNPDGRNATMGDPSFIAVQTPHGHGGGHADHHVTYLGFDSGRVTVDDDTGFEGLPASSYRFLRLDGDEILLDGVSPDVPEVLPSYYKNILRKDAYWPQARNSWNDEYVAGKGKKPKKSAVKAFMRFGKGTLSASRVSEVPWAFTHAGQTLPHLVGRFAEEVVYSDFVDATDAIVVHLRDLDEKDESKLKRTLVFQLISGLGGPLTLFVGNNVETDMEAAFARRITVRTGAADHLKFLNRVAHSKHGDGPAVVAYNPPPSQAGGGENSGPCGPGSGND